MIPEKCKIARTTVIDKIVGGYSHLTSNLFKKMF